MSTVYNKPNIHPVFTMTNWNHTDNSRHSRLDVAFGQAGLLQTHGVRRLCISSELVVVTNLHNTNTRVHITLGLSGSFKDTELSHSAPSALSFRIPLGLHCCVNPMCFPQYYCTTSAELVAVTMTKLPTMCPLGIMTTSITVFVAKLVCHR